MTAGFDAPDNSSGADQVLVGRLRAVNERLLLTSLRSQAAAEGAERLLAELAQAAGLDELTQLPTRSVLFDRFTQSTAGTAANTGRVAVLFVDIDQFKRVNDTLGHAVGDDALVLIAGKLSRCIGARDTLCRHGGDEFVILLRELPGGESVEAIVAATLVSVSEPMTIRGYPVAVTASIGIASFPDDGRDLLSLIEKADAAMYRAKRRGAGTVRYHEASIDARVGEPGSFVLRGLHSRSGIDAAVHQGAHDQVTLRDANERLVLATLNAHLKIEDAESIQRRQTHFLALLAHELRNPLAPVRNVAAILPSVLPGNPALMRLQSILDRQVQQLSRLIDDLLDVSRMHTGKLRMTLSEVDMADVVSDSESACRASLNARRQNFVTDIPFGGILVSGDAVRLTQIVTNLIDNASKYTADDGNIVLSIVADAERLIMTVSDDGIGIAPASLPHIFDLFAQDSAAVEVNRTGLGIGLAVVRDLVTAHGGSVVATSDGMGRGSQFVVTLPLAAHDGF